ncbi:MAG: hypothetical protein ACLFPE_01220 [Bacteroidales bacterium]
MRRYLYLFHIIFLLASCAGNQQDKPQDETGRLEQFLNIPVYPGAEMVMLFTDDGDEEIPRRTKPATVSLAVDHHDSVPAFYEKELGHQFLVDTTGGNTYYKLVFEKEDWEYEIMVGQDRFRNRPIFTITIMEPL